MHEPFHHDLPGQGARDRAALSAGQERHREEQARGGGNFLASLPIIGTFFGGQEKVVQEATYEALEKVPGADALLSVRIRTQRKYSFPLFYREECATVQGKAFAINTAAGSAE